MDAAVFRSGERTRAPMQLSLSLCALSAAAVCVCVCVFLELCREAQICSGVVGVQKIAKGES
jgi:hypothetical protein